jgi:hypothetical protein
MVGRIFLIYYISHKDFNPAIHPRDDVHTTDSGIAFYTRLLGCKIYNILSKDEKASGNETMPI